MPDADEVAKLIAKLLSEITGKEVEAKFVGGGDLMDHVKSHIEQSQKEYDKYKGTKPDWEGRVPAKFKERFDVLNEAAAELSKRMKKIERVFLEMAQEKSSLWDDICRATEVDPNKYFIHYDEDRQMFQAWKQKDDDGKENSKPKKRFVFDDDDE